MKPKSLHQPHDKFFKKIFSRIPIATSLLEKYLPQELSSLLDWKTLELIPGTFIDPSFKSSESDLLFKVQYKQSTDLAFLLFEHHHKEFEGIWKRIYLYTYGIWESSPVKELNLSYLPVVIPIVLSQSPRPWKTSPRFIDASRAPKSLTPSSTPQSFFPPAQFHLISLSEIPYHQIQGHPLEVLALKAMKAEITGDLLSNEVWDEERMQQIADDELDFLLTYILNSRKIDKEQFFHKLNQLHSQPINQKVMTLLEQIQEESIKKSHEQGFQKGIQKGKDEGVQQGQTQLLHLLLHNKFHSLPRWVEKKLKVASTDDIIRWSERILYKNSLKEIFE